MTYLIIEESSKSGTSPKTLYLVDVDKKQNELEFEYGKYVHKIMSEHKIQTNPFFVNLIMGKPTTHDLSVHAKILNKHTFEEWLESNYVVEKVPFITHFNTNKSKKIKNKRKR